MPDLAPGWWALAGATAALLLVVVTAGVRRRRAGRPPSFVLADWLTWAFAIGCAVSAGEAIYTVLRGAAEHSWVAWTGVAILEGPMLVCALRARDASRPGGAGNPEPYVRMTWLLAGASSAVAALAYAKAGPEAMVLRALAPMVGAFLWHGALKIEARRTGTAKQRETRWRWTPDRILTHLGLLTAAASQTADAEIHMRLTRVADATIRAARAHQRYTERDTGWLGSWYGSRYSWRLWRLERLYRAAERDLDLTRNTERQQLLEQIIEVRNAAPALMLKAGRTRADLGLSEVEQPREATAQHAPPAVRHATHIVFRRAVEHDGGLGRNSRNSRGSHVETAGVTGGRTERNRGGTPAGTPDGTVGRNSWYTTAGTASDTPAPVGGTAERPGESLPGPSREEILAEIDKVYRATGKLQVRPIARKFNVAPATVQRAVDHYREAHNLNRDGTTDDSHDRHRAGSRDGSGRSGQDAGTRGQAEQEDVAGARERVAV